MSELRTITFDDCARCGETHTELEVRAFTRPPEEMRGFGERLTTHFAICPTSDEPILWNSLRR